MLQKKNNAGLLIAIIGVIMVLVFRFSMRYIHRVVQINGKLKNIRFNTLDDYSSGAKISKNLFNKFKQ